MPLYFYLFLFFVTWMLISINSLLFERSQQLTIKNGVLKELGLFISCSPIIVFLATRVGIGTDYYNYKILYEYFERYGFTYLLEYGVQSVFYLSNFFDYGYNGVLFVFGLLSFYLGVLAIRIQIHSKYFPVAVLMYLCLYFGALCNIMAQMIALSFFMLAQNEMMKKDHTRYLLYNVAGLAFHSSLIVFLPFYKVYNLFIKKYIATSCLIVFLTASLFFINPSILDYVLVAIGLPEYSNYIKMKSTNAYLYELIYHFPLYIIEIVQLILLKKRFTSREICDRFGLYIFLIVCELSSFIIGLGVSWGGRLAYFFSINHVYINTKMIDCFKNKFEIIILLLFYYMIYFVMTAYFSEFNNINKAF